MKLNVIDSQVTSSGNVKTQGFKIATSAKAFKILSNNLYKNKIRAIIRELSCNAIDGHIANGNIGNFDVQLPSVLEKSFTIRDYGCGMNEDAIMNLYTTYFASTKAESNDYVGALGLGSKSPFSYTDVFSITSWCEGLKTVYSAFIKDGEPSISKLFEEASDEPSGIEISVPTKDDINAWKTEAAYVYRTFTSIIPNGNYEAIKFDEFGIYKHTNSSNYRENENYAQYSEFSAVMGNIAYPLPSNMVKNNILAVGINRYDKVFIKFELGELDITPSREELSFDDQTVEAIKKRLSDIDLRVSGKYLDICKKHDNLIDLSKELISLGLKPAMINYIMSNQVFLLKDGTKVSDLNAKTLIETVPENYYERNNGWRIVSQCNRRSAYKFNNVRDELNQLSSISYPVFLVMDMKSGHVKTMDGLCELKKIDQKNQFIYKIEVDDVTDPKSFYSQVKERYGEKNIKTFYMTQCSDARKLTMPDRVVIKGKPNATLYELNSKNEVVISPVFVNAEMIKKSDAYFIDVYNGDFCYYDSKGNKFNFNYLTQDNIKMIQKELKIKSVYVITAKYKDTMRAANMKSFLEATGKYIDSLVPTELTSDIFPSKIDGDMNYIINTLNAYPALTEFVNYLKSSTKGNKYTDIFKFATSVFSNAKYLISNFAKIKNTIENKSNQVSNNCKTVKESGLLYFALRHVRSYETLSAEIQKDINYLFELKIKNKIKAVTS